MKVHELIEQLNKLNPNAQVLLSVRNFDEPISRAVTLEVSSPFSCVLRDHMLERRKNVVTLRGVEYEEVPEMIRLSERI